MNQALDFAVHVTGLGFPEGPVALPGGGVVFVDLLHASIRAWQPRQGVSVLAELDGAPNGMCLAPDGRQLWISNNGGIAPDGLGVLNHADRSIPGCIQVLDPGTGQIRQLTRGGEAPERPNDVVHSPEGLAVFTDPQNWERLRDAPEAYRGGRVMLAREDGTTEVLAVLKGFPNGLIFHPDGSLLVNLTRTREVWRFPWIAGGGVGEPSLFCTFPEGFAPDGMCLAGGHLLVAGSVGDRIGVVDLAGNILGTAGTGTHTDPTNLCLVGDRIFVTLGFARCLASVPLADLMAAL